MPNSYDQLIYSSLPRPESQPSHLATIAKLFGLSSPDIHKSRILELGCGTGGNIIPLAELFPHGKFLGIDLSGKQIEIGKKIISDLNFKNIELRTESILDFSINSGEFDFIICHGVFSWVNKAVQDKILEILSGHLSRDGLAYISYNTLPGWRGKGALREMMLYHTRGVNDPELKVQQAKSLIKFLSDSQPDPRDPYSQSLYKSCADLESVPPYYVFHEFLEDENQAFYFHEFHSQLDSKNLAYLGEAQFSLMTSVDLPVETQEHLESFSERVKLEQYLDFIRNRRLRDSILCRKERSINYPITTLDLSNFFVAAEFASEQNEISEGNQTITAFGTVKGGQIRSSNPLIIEALRILYQTWPAQIKLETLLRRAAALIKIDIKSASGNEQRQYFYQQFFLFYSANLLELKLFNHNAAAADVVKPLASALARYQASRQERITSLRHDAVLLEAIVLQVLSLLNGKNDRKAIVKELHNLCNKGELVFEALGQEESKIDLQKFLTTAIDRSIELLAKNSFLLGNN